MSKNVVATDAKSSGIYISYTLDDFLKYKTANELLPINLSIFCTEKPVKLTFRDTLSMETKMIIDSFRSGVNPNDIMFLGSIREYLNKINQKNYEEYSEKIRKLNYKTFEHFDTLTSELLIRAMTDNLAIKGVDMPTSSDIYADIALGFSSFFIKEDETETKFLTKLIESCQKYFIDYTDPTKPLDQNNQYRCDGYKGFMNFMGLLYARNIITSTIILACLTTVKDLIFTKGWGTNECENAYDGFKKMLHQVLLSLEKKSVKKGLSEKDEIFLETIETICNKVILLNNETSKLRKFTCLMHDGLCSRVKDLKKKSKVRTY